MQNDNQANFKSWFVDVLEPLYRKREAGFVVLIVSLGLLERYLREKSGVHEANLDDRFYDELRKVLPALQSRAEAKVFWHVHRNGLFHQVTLSLSDRQGIQMPRSVLSHDFQAAVSIARQNQPIEFKVNPVRLSKQVISTIESDFTCFEGSHSTNHPLPVVKAIDRKVTGTSTP